MTDTTVIVTAHYDSTGGSSTARGPGADDNGSGVVVLLEALRVLADAGFKPKDTLEFHFYGGEEGGLLGSQDVFSSYRASGKTVLAVVNQDMAGYSPSGKISIYTDYADSSLTAYTRVIATAYVGETTSDTCGYGCSDHASARSNGFRMFLWRFFASPVHVSMEPAIHHPSLASLGTDRSVLTSRGLRVRRAHEHFLALHSFSQ